jgi:hypothetical protein
MSVYKNKITLNSLITGLKVLIVASLLLIYTAPAYATPNLRPDAGNSASNSSSTTCAPSDALCAQCQGKTVKITDNSGKSQYACQDCASGICSDPAVTTDCTNKNCDLIKTYINPGIKLLSVVFGLIVMVSLIMGGIQYSTSEGDPQKVSKAKHRLTMTVISLVAYFFLFAMLQWLVPGGIFNK